MCLILPQKVGCSHSATPGKRLRKQLRKESPSNSDVGASQGGAPSYLVKAGVFKVEAKQVLLS